MKRIFLMIALLSISTAARAQSPSFIGAWKINLAKSTYNPGPKPAAGYVSIYQWTLRPDGFIVGINLTIAADGTPGFNQSLAKHDGKDYRTFSAATLAEFQAKGTTSGTLAFKVIDQYSVEIIGKGPDGKVTNPNQRRIRTISADGKTMTDATKGVNAQGQAVDNVLVYDRVK